MVDMYYSLAFGVSMILMLVYVLMYHRHYDIHISMLFVLLPLSNFGQLMYSRSENLPEVLLAGKVLYISGCYSMLMITLAVFSLCDIKIRRIIKLLLYLITTVVFFFTLQIGQNDLYYKSATMAIEHGSTVLIKEYGVLHTAYLAMDITYFAMGTGAIIFTLFKKKQVSNRFILILALPEGLALLSYFAGRPIVRAIGFNIELMPLAYDIALAVYLFIAHKLVLYNLPDTVIDTVVQKGDTGFVSFDFKMRYLGSNQTAKGIFLELNDLIIDRPITTTALDGTLLSWLNDFSRDNSNDKVYYEAGEKTYLVSISYLSDGSHRRGYQMFITDDTKNRQYINLLDSFNTELKAEVKQKTEHIIEMHDNLILSMATMVESRDNSTGGHIRRTSEGVRILVDEMKKSGFALSEDLCRNLIKAAPMHDLGKIAVDDAILRKPGRFEPWEFEIMKTHAAKGAEIVHQILKGTDDEGFKVLAENVAHYHHERWDGSGYPEGLKGEQIPLEARIMAIADVYDALVSKRVYKEKMSFEQADKIIMEGMGKHFDKQLEPFYIAARPRLEEYYSNMEQ